MHTHLEQWAAYDAAPGEQLGVRCLAQGSHLSCGQFLAEPRFEPTTLGYKSNPLSTRPWLPCVKCVCVFFCQVKVGLERSGEVSGREKAWLLKYSHLEMRNLGSERPKSTTLSCFDIRTFSVNLFIMKPFIKPLEIIYAFFRTPQFCNLKQQ